MKAAQALELPLPALGRALRAREVTAVALMEESLHRLETRGRTLNAVAALLPARARQAAVQADHELASGHDRGPLHGIPYGLKDLFPARGAPTTWGAAIFAGRVIDEDAAVVQRLEQAGAVLVAKLACIQLAGAFGYARPSASLQGATKTPWDIKRWAGGSSSGSAAAVSAKCVPFSIGTETWGSILTPASFCGVTGMRPSFGRASRSGGMVIAWSLDKLGPLATSAEDALLVLRAISGEDKGDSATWTSLPPLGVAPPQRRLRIAAVLPAELERTGPRIFAAYQTFLAALGQVAQVERVAFNPSAQPWLGIPAEAVTSLTLSSESVTAFEELLENGALARLPHTDAAEKAKAYSSIPVVDYLRAQRLRARLRVQFRSYFQTYDAICTPSLGFNVTPAPLLTDDLTLSFEGDDPLGAAGNLLGLPAMALPGPLVEGLPTSMQLLGATGHEETLAACAMALQAKTSWHLQRPPGV